MSNKVPPSGKTSKCLMEPAAVKHRSASGGGPWKRSWTAGVRWRLWLAGKEALAVTGRMSQDYTTALKKL